MEHELMIDHVGIPVTNIADAKSFFLEALAPLSIGVIMEFDDAVGLGRDRKPFFWIGTSEKITAPVHLAFAADSRTQVDEFHRRALAAGGKDNGAPGVRAHYHPNYYGAFVIGPDGHNIEAVCHRPEP